MSWNRGECYRSGGAIKSRFRVWIKHDNLHFRHFLLSCCTFWILWLKFDFTCLYWMQKLLRGGKCANIRFVQFLHQKKKKRKWKEAKKRKYENAYFKWLIVEYWIRFLISDLLNSGDFRTFSGFIFWTLTRFHFNSFRLSSIYICFKILKWMR